MNLLFISNEIGVDAPGIVFQKLLANLSYKCNVKVFAPIVNESQIYNKKIDYSLLPKLFRLPYIIDRVLVSIFGSNIIDWFWSRKCATIIEEQCNEVDVVISLISSNNCAPLYTGERLSKQLKAKWVIYSVDAIPAPIGWSKNNAYYHSLRNFMKRRTKKSDAFFSSNPIMLEYQLSCLSSEYRGYKGIVFTPFVKKEYNYPDLTKSPVFLYTGSMYGLRHVDSLLKSFINFLDEHPNSSLIFVGNIDISLFKGYELYIANSNIQIFSYTNDLEPMYSKSTVLIDLAADIPNDVFLSSKILNYLPLHRPIIAIGGENSTASIIFSKDKSIIISTYAEKDILKALKQSISKEYLPGEQREHYLAEFSDIAISEKFYKDLVRIVRNSEKV